MGLRQGKDEQNTSICSGRDGEKVWTPDRISSLQNPQNGVWDREELEITGSKSISCVNYGKYTTSWHHPLLICNMSMINTNFTNFRQFRESNNDSSLLCACFLHLTGHFHFTDKETGFTIHSLLAHIMSPEKYKIWLCLTKILISPYILEYIYDIKQNIERNEKIMVYITFAFNKWFLMQSCAINTVVWYIRQIKD